MSSERDRYIMSLYSVTIGWKPNPKKLQSPLNVMPPLSRALSSEVGANLTPELINLERDFQREKVDLFWVRRTAGA
ncbi:hypothetical protein YC2023_081808 [Brassica napus]